MAKAKLKQFQWPTEAYFSGGFISGVSSIIFIILPGKHARQGQVIPEDNAPKRDVYPLRMTNKFSLSVKDKRVVVWLPAWVFVGLMLPINDGLELVSP